MRIPLRLAAACLALATIASPVQAADPLPSWNDGPAKKAILDFVAKTTNEKSPDFVPVAERIAVFDNDGTLWCEQHTDADREYAYDRKSPFGRLDKALDEAPKRGWIIVNMKDDWRRVFAFDE